MDKHKLGLTDSFTDCMVTIITYTIWFKWVYLTNLNGQTQTRINGLVHRLYGDNNYLNNLV